MNRFYSRRLACATGAIAVCIITLTADAKVKSCIYRVDRQSDFRYLSQQHQQRANFQVRTLAAQIFSYLIRSPQTSIKEPRLKRSRTALAPDN